MSKYVAVFDYINEALIVLSATSDGVSIISFTSIIRALVGIASASLTLFFSLTKRIVKKLLNMTRNKKKKHDKILMLAKNKLSSTETLISQALIDMEISHEEFIAILKEKDKYEKDKYCTLRLLFTYCLFQSERKHGAFGLCSLFTFKQAFGQLQQIRKRNGLKNAF